MSWLRKVSSDYNWSARSKNDDESFSNSIHHSFRNEACRKAFNAFQIVLIKSDRGVAVFDESLMDTVMTASKRLWKRLLDKGLVNVKEKESKRSSSSCKCAKALKLEEMKLSRKASLWVDKLRPLYRREGKSNGFWQFDSIIPAPCLQTRLFAKHCWLLTLNLRAKDSYNSKMCSTL